jgi:hypothetical protein
MNAIGVPWCLKPSAPSVTTPPLDDLSPSFKRARLNSPSAKCALLARAARCALLWLRSGITCHSVLPDPTFPNLLEFDENDRPIKRPVRVRRLWLPLAQIIRGKAGSAVSDGSENGVRPLRAYLIADHKHCIECSQHCVSARLICIGLSGRPDPQRHRLYAVNDRAQLQPALRQRALQRFHRPRHGPHQYQAWGHARSGSA